MQWLKINVLVDYSCYHWHSKTQIQESGWWKVLERMKRCRCALALAQVLFEAGQQTERSSGIIPHVMIQQHARLRRYDFLRMYATWKHIQGSPTLFSGAHLFMLLVGFEMPNSMTSISHAVGWNSWRLAFWTEWRLHVCFFNNREVIVLFSYSYVCSLVREEVS